ncbi:4Fe-4S ferredoxin [Gordonibacter sp. 28C]|uniref:4Fe-4S dicluster domain-containing protein n=1 Tax=Gordonibacter sp. 28C TaxID=2078569 RepID=UPI000DF77FB7|nr:4Fe-4S dicluster domain-containing protein [Gordonibacter sp. 28C]RDB64491.1 4Fe-4S ferredoxin [Gordonibacter sp. 28C]
MTRLGFVFNLDTCSDLRGCMIACKNKTHSFLGSHYMETFTNMSLDFPNPNTYFVPVSCQHCEHPTCVSVCPENVFSKREDGIVAVGDTAVCAKCADKPCVEACPYHAIDLDPVDGKIGKCDLCADLIDQGEAPVCAAGCLTKSILFGDFDDPESVVAQTVAAWSAVGCDHQLKPETGNGPAMHYLLSKKTWEDMDRLYSPAWHNE